MAFLQIYDSSDSSIVSTVNARGDGGGRVLLGVTNGADLPAALDRLVSAGQTFDRILFETHGSPGRIYFNHRYVDSTWLTANMVGHNFENLCPNAARVYFNGCNVAAEGSGSTFLRTIAGIFLRRAGGSVFGHTSLGLVLPVYSNFTGHVVHLTGDLKTVYASAGGRIIEETTQSDI